MYGVLPGLLACQRDLSLLNCVYKVGLAFSVFAYVREGYQDVGYDLCGLAFGFLAWFPTMPVNAYWDLTKPATRYAYGSLDVEVFVATYETHAAMNMFLDVVVLAVAVPFFFKPGMGRNSYWGLLSLFILGGVYVLLDTELCLSGVEWLTNHHQVSTYCPYGASRVSSRTAPPLIPRSTRLGTGRHPLCSLRLRYTYPRCARRFPYSGRSSRRTWVPISW